MSARRIPVATMVAGGLLAAGVAAAGALTATGALAAGSTSSPSASTPSPGTPAAPGPGPRGFAGYGGGGLGLPGLGFGGRMLHGEVVVTKPGGTGTETLLVQEGTISAKSGNDVTVKSSDGFTLVWTLNSSTTVRTGWTSGSVKDLAVGDTVSATGTKSGSGGTARFVAERPKGTASGNGADGYGGRRHFGPNGPGKGTPSSPSSPSTPGPSTSGALYGNA